MFSPSTSPGRSKINSNRHNTSVRTKKRATGQQAKLQQENKAEVMKSKAGLK